jgi:hypothetical protein
MSQVDVGNGLEMMSKISIVDKFGSMFPEYVEILQEQSQCGMEDPQVGPLRWSSALSTSSRV